MSLLDGPYEPGPRERTGDYRIDMPIMDGPYGDEAAHRANNRGGAMAGAATVSGLIELIEQGLIPDDGAELVSLLEMLPEACEKWAAACKDLADWVASQPALGASAAPIGERVADMQVHFGAAQEAASQAFLEASETARWWNGDDGS